MHGVGCRWFWPFVLLPLLAACGESASITGEVRDNFGAPVEGARIVVAGGAAEGVSDAGGKFTVTHVPGRFPVTIGREGFTTGAYTLTLHAEAGRPPVNATLQRLPPAAGLWIVGESGYTAANPCLIGVRPIADPLGEAFLIQRGVPATVTATPGGRTKLTLVVYEVPESPYPPNIIARAYDGLEFYRTQPPANRDTVRVDEAPVTALTPEFPSAGQWMTIDVAEGVYTYVGRVQPLPGTPTPDLSGPCFFFSVGPAAPPWLPAGVPPAALEDFVAAVRRCWPATPEGVARTQIATLAIAFNADGTLSEPPRQVRHLLDTVRERARYPAALADAITAVTACQPYRMFPADAFDAWQKLTVTFSVAEMLAATP